MIRILWALLQTEAIKLRGTAAAAMAVAVPAVACLLDTVRLFNRDPEVMTTWLSLIGGAGWALWLWMMAPLLLSFEAACLLNLEHGTKQWKQLFAFPVPRWAVYATKILACGLLIGVTFGVFTLGFIGEALIFSGVRGLHLAAVIPWSAILVLAARTWAASWLMIVIQSWGSARISGLGIPFVAGLVAMIAGFFIVQINRRDYSSWYPWLLSESAANIRHDPLVPAVVGCAGGVLLAILACWDLGRRREHA